MPQNGGSMEIIKTKNISECINSTVEVIKDFGKIDSDPCIVFAEDEITLSLELKLASVSNGGFFNNLITTFKNYVRQNKMATKMVSKESSVMILKKLLFSHPDEFNCFKNFKNSPNLTIDLYELITQLEGANISPEELKDFLSSDDDLVVEGQSRINEGLKEKIKDITNIYSLYVDYLNENKLYDSVNYLNLLPEIIDTEDFKDTTIVVTGFSNMTKQREEIYKLLEAKAKKLIAVVIADDSSCFYTNETFNRLLPLFKDIEIINTESNMTRDCIALKDGLYNPSVFSASHKKIIPNADIKVLEGETLSEEVEYVVRDIIKETRNNNRRYKDIAVGVGSLETYKGKIQELFEESKIPYYINEPTYLSKHPLCKLIEDYINLEKHNYQQDEYIRFIQNSLFSRDTSLIEEYISFIKTNSLFKRGRGDKEGEIIGASKYAPIDNTVKNVVDQLNMCLESSMKAGKVSNIIGCIKNMLTTLDVERGIKDIGEYLNEVGEPIYYDFNVRALDQLNELFNEIEEILGDSSLPILEFKTIFRGGAQSKKITNIPLFKDAIFIGECKDVKMKTADCLYIIGLNGEVPFTKSDTQILSDTELTTLDSFKIKIEPKVNIINARERENVCLTLISFREKLVLSHSSLVDSKKSSSELLKYVLNIFDIKEQSIKNLMEVEDGFLTIGSAIREVARLKSRNYLDSPLSKEDSSKVFSDNDEYKEKFEDVDSFNENPPEYLEVTDGVLPTNTISPTSIEGYFECPYKNYAGNILGLKEEDDGDLKVYNVGTLYHWVFENYVKQIKEIDSETKSDSFVSDLVDKAFELDDFASFIYSPKFEFSKEVIKKECIEICGFMYRSKGKVKFETAGCEVSFGDGEKYGPIVIKTTNGDEYKIKGKVDRIDKVRLSDGNEYLRVIDYKTGKPHTISEIISEFYTGRKIQIYLYPNAFLNENTKFAGSYYFYTTITPNKKIDLRLVGKTLDNQDIIIASDTLLNGVSYRSDQIHANTKKDGDFDKNTGILSEEQMNAQLEYAKKIAAKGAEEIDLGFIKPTPYENACEYCKYKGMCGYDCKTMGERKVDKIGIEAILEAVSEDKGE